MENLTTIVNKIIRKDEKIGKRYAKMMAGKKDEDYVNLLASMIIQHEDMSNDYIVDNNIGIKDVKKIILA